jgi:hypothetical protein
MVGTVVLDDSPLAGVQVTLHRVTSQASGAVDSTFTNATGTFRLPIAPVVGAETAFYFATAEYQSIAFFGQLNRGDALDPAYTIEVFDTASVLPQPVRIVSRYMVMIPALNGSWEVDEIVRVLNPSPRALVARDGMPPWQFHIPAGATDFQAVTSDYVGGLAELARQVLPHELTWMEDRVLHVTPVIPGFRDIFIRYRLPADRSESTLLVGEPTDTFNIFVLQPSHLTRVNGLATQRQVNVENEQFMQYGAVGLSPGSRIDLEWAGIGPPIDPVVAAVALTVLLLAVAVGVALRNQPPLRRAEEGG